MSLALIFDAASIAPFLVALWVASFLHLQACWTSMVWSGMEGVEATEQPGIDSRLYNALDWNGGME